MLWEWKATKPTANQPGTSNPLWEKTMPSRKASTNLGLELHPTGLFNSWHDYKIFKILQLFQDSRTQSEPQKIPARRNFTRKINGTSEAWRQRFWAPHRWFRRNFHWSNGQMVKWSNGQMVKSQLVDLRTTTLKWPVKKPAICTRFDQCRRFRKTIYVLPCCLLKNVTLGIPLSDGTRWRESMV